MKQGQKPYSAVLVRIKNELEKMLEEKYGKHIEVNIFADLIDIKDMSWSNAIEGYLSGQKFNLFVAPKYYIDAYNCLKKLLSTYQFYGTALVDQERIIERDYKCENNSLAEEIITDDQTIWQEIQSCQDESILKKLRLYEDSLLSLSKLYRIEEQLTDALKERVWLKSGGYLVIQPTEALTVIDVNTGKCIQSKNNREEVFFKVNQEAAIEIAKQLRLRNYSGIILIDFIDMKESCHNTELLELLSGMVIKDPVKTTVVDITKLGLVELTRKKIRKPLYEQLQ